MKRFVLFSLIIVGILYSSCCPSPGDASGIEKSGAQLPQITEPQVNVDLDDVLKRGKLIALTGYDVTSYFIYKGEPQGFEYDLLKRFAHHLDVELEVVIVDDLDEIFNELNRGRGDLIAYNLTVTKERKRMVSFADHHTEIHQVLVQRLPDNWREMKRHEIDKKIITSPLDLIGKTVHVRKGSSYYARLVNLSDEIGGDINIVGVRGDLSTEELIRMVSEGEIDYTIADENIALINRAYISNIDIRVPISLPQRISWTVRKNSPKLRAAINLWLREIKSEPTFNVIYNKYYRNTSFFRSRVRSDFFSVTGDKISPYDEIIKKNAEKLNWDWRFLAAQIYKESGFDPKAKSWAGAYGLMQLIPRTARHFGAENVANPEENIRAGTNYIKWLQNYWKEIPDSLNRLKFILASYNVGQEHVQDARRLAEKYGADPDLWQNSVATYLIKKAQPKFYTDEVVQYGYCRGNEPVNYVEEIFQIYSHYQKFIGP